MKSKKVPSDLAERWDGLSISNNPTLGDYKTHWRRYILVKPNYSLISRAQEVGVNAEQIYIKVGSDDSAGSIGLTLEDARKFALALIDNIQAVEELFEL